MTAVLFFVFGAASIAGALGVVLSENPVHSALFLVQTLMSVAVLFLIQDAELVAAVQVIVYAGAIVVLFLFVIMLLGVDRREALTETLRFQRPIALALGACSSPRSSTWPATGGRPERTRPVVSRSRVATSATTSNASRGCCSPTSSGRSSSRPCCS